MLRIYFKQAVEMLKQNMFISLIAILGTALAIMMIMSIVVVDEIQNISISPEPYRNRTYYIQYQIEKDTVKDSWNSGSIDYKIYREYLADMSTPEYVSLCMSLTMPVGKEGEDETIKADVKVTNAYYWNILDFVFIEGKPYGQEEFESGVAQAVISETMAKQLFKGEQALGQTLEINYSPYRIVGIVKDVSPVFNVASSSIWVPVTSRESFMRSNQYTVLLLLKDKSDYQKTAREIRALEMRYGANNPNKTLTLVGPDSHRERQMKIVAFSEEEKGKGLATQYRKQVFIILILLLVPAVNLSGLSLSRIKKRTAEIGVRKAFGAKKHIILMQVLCENLITSLLGGMIGLVLSYFAVYQLKHWLLKIPADSAIPAGVFVSFPVFLAVFVVCVLVNLLSAGIPAWRASKISIVNSLNENDK